ncbi:MAG TPA: tRNA (adenosine(37)-N6)-threonylcarbamoyltransferase complex dimerization subunit type 1 TsaB [Pyrinomonadaceae bacterium]|nr:tRNA (adenosine(37)-N6)-threonylcarbamoyltransferase complex dimerization subunit type 1 TsaB [Pyrinomonadaceae bacterium]
MSLQPLILSIETATTTGSIAVASGSLILSSKKGDGLSSHSNTLLSDIDDMLRHLDRRFEEIDFFAAAIGPGSFTGLRIGIATIKALAMTANRPCAGIPTLEAVARSAGENLCVAATLLAGRGEVFAQLFSVSAEGRVTEIDQPAHLPPREVLKKYQYLENLCWAGEGAEAHKAEILAFDDEVLKAGKKWRIASDLTNLAENVSALALQRSVTNELTSAENLHAIYVRPSDAELKK